VGILTALTTTDCITCGVTYAIPTTLYDQHKKMGGFHHCPNGHQQGWSADGTSDFANLRRERDRLAQKIAEKDDEIKLQRERREAADRREAAARGVATRLKNRAINGVCPCCHRTVSQLARHMKSKHPDFATAEIVPLQSKSG
jgi:hypothetical protein